MLRVESITIKGVGGIEDLSIPLRPGLNLLVGPNGSGKTTILECIGHSFFAYAEGSSLVRRSSRSKRGAWSITLKMGEPHRARESKDIAVEIFHPSEVMFLNEGFEDAAREVLVFKADRTIPYTDVASLARDPLPDMNRFTREAARGVPTDDVKSWFVRRYLWSAHVGGLSPAQAKNLAHARECFRLLDPTVAFSRVAPESNDVLVSTREGEAYFEYLSAGHKACLAVLLGLLKEIDYRFKDSPIDAASFEGLVLIDEIELHLHPEWHVQMLTGLRALLPKAQIIATTASPHIIQAAEEGEVIALGFDASGKIIRRPLETKAFGFQGYTIEEILRDVLGFTETRAPAYVRAMGDFERAVEAADRAGALAAWKELDLLLHPESPARRELLAALEKTMRPSS